MFVADIEAHEIYCWRRNWGIASHFRDYGHVVTLQEFEDKLAGAVSSKYAARDLSPVSKKSAVVKEYSQYVETYKSDVRGPGGEVIYILVCVCACERESV